jgi:Lsr2
MATITSKVDDLDGKTDGAETYRLSLGDDAVDIDLAPANLKKLREALALYFEKGRPVQRKSPDTETSAARIWLRQHGHNLPERGRIPEDKMALYRNRPEQ